MSKFMTAAQTVAQLKKWGISAKYYPGWETRTRPGAHSDARGVMVHHTGSQSQSDDYLGFLFKRGRPEDGIPGPLCNVATDIDGDLHVGATGRANHAGRGSSTTLAAVTAEKYAGYSSELKPGADNVDGNAHYYGNEVRYDGARAMTEAQRRTATLHAAAICDFHGWSALAVIGHREHTRRKNDPGKEPMDDFRRDVQKLLNAGPPNLAENNDGKLETMDDYYAHVHAKATALELEEQLTKLGATMPARLKQTQTGDSYFAHYWAKRAHTLADLLGPAISKAVI